jgi:hypothetical protein
MPKPAAQISPEADRLDEIVRLLVLDLTLRFDTQSQLIAELDRAGLGVARIAALIGTTPGTVKVAVQRSRRRADSAKSTEKT